jgi:3-oxoacyl-[acyl-carrier protein] reductase
MTSHALQTRTALITGAGNPEGIGFASAKGLGLLGYRVGITSTTDRIWERVSELEALGIEAFGFVADLTDQKQVDALVAGFVAKFKTLDVLVNNAGMTSVSSPSDPNEGPLENYSLTNWHEVMTRNVDTTMLMTKAAMPFIKSSSAGRVVIVSSITGPFLVMRNNVGYATSKTALVGFTRAVALDYAHLPITVNAVAPGWIATSHDSEHEILQGTAVPMKRRGTADEVASAIIWLASPGASYITGQCIVIDGGNALPEERA